MYLPPRHRRPGLAVGLLLGVIALTVGGPAAAQDVPPPDIVGSVVEARGGEPMPGAMVRILVDDDEARALEVASTDAEGRWEVRLRLDEDPGRLVAEVQALGHVTVRSDPFRLPPPGETLELPTIEIQPDPVELEAVEVQGRRRWWQLRHPRDIVRDRQLEGRGVFIPGVFLQQTEARSAAEAIAELVDGLDVDFASGTATLVSARAGPCPIVLVNEWRSAGGGLFSLGLTDADEIGVVEVYKTYQDVPEDLRRRLAQEMDGSRALRTLEGATTDEERCPVVNVWRWSEWNRGMGDGP